MEFRILGPLEAIGSDGPLTLRGVKRRGLLAYLLVHRGQVISSDRLAEALGDGDSGASGLGTIQTYLSQLRKVLPQVGGELLTQPAGYQFDVDDALLDAARFESMIRAASGEPDPGGRLRLLDGALALWRGAALEEFSWPWVLSERARLDRRRLDALSLRAETRLERGEHLEALSELDALTDEYPLDERLCAQRMLAAYRAGRQADALRAFQQLRRSLAHELGVEPGPELVELERRMLDHDPALRLGALVRNGGALDVDVARAGPHGSEPVEPGGEYEDALQNIRAASHLKLGLATVAIVITDLVGSTSLRTNIGAHRADEVERWHEGILYKAVADYQGTIVKRLGDGAMAVFTTATDAVAAAAAIQTRVARANNAGSAELRVRIGVSAGEVVVEHDDVRGLPPTEAARLCARAEGGQILTTQLVENLAAARSAATFRGVGVFDLKGLPGPVPLYEVSWPIGATDVVPTPEQLTASHEFAFVGRGPELASLHDAWDEVCTDSRLGSVLVLGEAGAGKSRLTAEFVRATASERHTVLYGHCDEVAGYPFQPVAEWLRHYLAHASPAAVGMLRARHGGQLSRLVPELVSAHTGGAHALSASDHGDPYPLYEAVLGWLALVADAAPVLLVLDDLQWASGPTIAVLEHVLAAPPSFPGLVVATCRDGDPNRSDLAAMFARLGSDERAFRRVTLGGLEIDDVYAMVGQSRGASGEGPVRDLAREIHEESAGNPLFVTSLARQFESHGVQRSQASRQPLPPPERVMELVVDRLAGLAPETVELLQKAAVTGTEFEFSLLRFVADTDDDRLLDLLTDAVAARYLVELPGTPLRYRFSHGVVRNALLETVPVSQRMRLHRQAGRGLEELGRAADDRTIASLAYHFSQAAGLGEADRAIEYCRLAADVATQQLAHQEAVGWYQRALDVADVERTTEDTRYELLLALGRAQVYAGDEASRSSLFRAYRIALDIGDASGAAEAVLSLNRGFFSRTGETDHEAVESLQATLERYADDDGSTKAMLLAALASELVWAPDGDRRFALSDDAVAMARQAADPRALARVLSLRNMTILAPDTLPERTANCYELLGLAEQEQDELLRFDAAFQRGGTALEAGDADAAHDMVEVAARVADRLRQPRLLWQARLMQTAQAVFRGALEDAEYFAAEALARGRQAGQNREATLFHTEQLFEIRRWQGRLDEHVDQLRPFAGHAGWDFGYAITRYLYEAGDVDNALRIYRTVVASQPLPLRRDMLVTPTLYNLAFLAARDGDVTTAEVLYDALLPYADSFANTTIAKPVGWHSLGLLAATLEKLDVAESGLRRAIAVHELVGAPLFRAESEIELARVLHTAGRDDEAVPLLETARATAAARGSALLTQQCDALTGA